MWICAYVNTCSYMWVWCLCVQVHLHLNTHLCLGQCLMMVVSLTLSPFCSWRQNLLLSSELDNSGSLAIPGYTMSPHSRITGESSWQPGLHVKAGHPKGSLYAFRTSSISTITTHSPYSITLHVRSGIFPWTTGLHKNLFSFHFHGWHFIFNISKFSAVDTLFLSAFNVKF